MEFEVIKASLDQKEIIMNLMQFYIYDFSEFIEAHVEENGRFSEYSYLNDYWTDDNRFPYLVKVDGHYAGFVLVRSIKEGAKEYFSIAEFFIMRKYRRAGLGKLVAKDIFHVYKGNWEVFQIEKNKPAQLFWRNVINEYTNGQFSERIEEGKKIIQEFVSTKE
ncbi:GNAT family N-acetyltransferase [Bacillus sp. FJAT-49711]|uniref:GNAT family N-acetyltransferase n=1 Tax=Bacillus sp. FJAT-49711 TaxID=2833585 RepID=UPI001BC8FC75|nr:GNAT family N-acetyltransferase [Bacillus sp. FJAT-49711]MBS4218433.1 GNAT family N-acetyltransferase [Bacillus sp. FJAT-49711]